MMSRDQLVSEFYSDLRRRSINPITGRAENLLDQWFQCGAG